MKMIFVVFVVANEGRFRAISDTIKTGENLKYHCDRYNVNICHLCESRKEADEIANAWNAQYKSNGTFLI